jgi:hypothetical protein
MQIEFNKISLEWTYKNTANNPQMQPPHHRVSPFDARVWDHEVMVNIHLITKRSHLIRDPVNKNFRRWNPSFDHIFLRTRKTITEAIAESTYQHDSQSHNPKSKSPIKKLPNKWNSPSQKQTHEIFKGHKFIKYTPTLW